MATLVKRGDIWHIQVRYKGKQIWKSTRTTNESIAKKYLEKVEAHLVLGSLDEFLGQAAAKDSKPGVDIKKHFEDFKRYLAQRRRSHVETDTRRIDCWKEYLLEKGIHDLQSITTRLVDDFVFSKLEGRSQTTKNYYIKALKQCLNVAEDWDLIDSNPIARYKPFRASQGNKIKAYSKQELDQLLKEAPDSLKKAILLLVNTGMRTGELYGLRWRDVNYRKKSIIVRPHDDFTTKSGKARAIPMNQACRKALKSLPQGKGDDPVYRLYAKPDKLRRAFSKLRKAIGFSGRIHDFRHTYVTRLIEEGIPLPRVQKVAGHADIRTTMKYEHLTVEDERLHQINITD